MVSPLQVVELPTSIAPITIGQTNITASLLPHCPKQFNCSYQNSSSVSFDIGRIPSYIAIASSSLSCLGSILIVLAFLLFKDLRTGAQKIITLLAIADFISAFGYIIGSGNFLVHFNELDSRKCKVFEIICEVQASVTSWSSLCSFCWTLILAFYFYMVIVYDRRQLAVKCLPLHNIVAWGAPLLVIIPLLAFGKLGYAPYAASNWCFVKHSQDEGLQSKKDNVLSIVVILVAGKFWEILTYISVIAVYAHIARYLSQRRRQQYVLAQAPQIEQAEKRLIYIPIVFLILRIWGTIQYFYSIGVSGRNHDGCIPHGVQIVFYLLGIVQAIGDPGQGWGNAILYIFMSPVMRERLFCKPCRRSFRRIGRVLLTFAPSTASANAREEDSMAHGYEGPRQVPHRREHTVSSVIVEESQPGPGSAPGPPPGFVHTNHYVQELSSSPRSSSDLMGTGNYV